MRRTLTLLLALTMSLCPLLAGEWLVEQLDGGKWMLYNDSGKFGGYQDGVLFICSPNVQAKKTFPLDKLPAGVLASASSATLRVYCSMNDYSWSKDKINGFNELLSLEINGHEMLIKTSDPRFPAKTSREAPLNYRWVDIQFPVAWLDQEQTVIHFSKRPSEQQDDFFYPGIDTSVPNTDTLVSQNGGKSYSRNGGNLKDDQGELMFRLILGTGGKRPEQTQPSDFAADFGSGKGMNLQGPAKLENRLLHLSGEDKGFALLEGTENANIAENGLSLVAIMRFREDGLKKTQNGMIFFKDKAYFLGRTGKAWNFSFCCDGKTWIQAAIGGEMPATDEWFHLAATVEKINEREQGNVGYLARVYVNGERTLEKMFKYINIDASDAPVQLGYCANWADYQLNADIAEAEIFQRPFTEAEVAAMAAKAPHVNMLPPGSFELSAERQAAFAALRDAAKSPIEKWLAQSLERAARTGDNRPGLPTAATLGFGHTEDELIAIFNQAQELYKIYASDQALLLMVKGEASGCYPIAGLFQRAAQCPVFAERTWEWNAGYRDAKWRGATLNSYTRGLVYTVEEKGDNQFLVTWKNDDFQATSNITFQGGRLESDLAIRPLSDKFTLTSVNFPVWQFAPLPGGKNYLAFPHMCGRLVENPFQSCNEKGPYPCCQVSMQFSAIYDERQHGVYFAMEDPLGRIKYYTVNSRSGKLQVSWQHPVAYAVENPGGNTYVSSGKAVLDLFVGDWFDAGQVYKRFLPSSNWWTEKLPREDTPEWYRNNPGWICESAGVKAAKEFLTLRDYFGVPCSASWCFWYNISQDDFPRYDPRESCKQGLKLMIEGKMPTEAYFNPHLWGYDPAKSYQWRGRLGERLAIKDEIGDPLTEKYSEGEFPLACPSRPELLTLLTQNLNIAVEAGINAIYNDQLAAGRPHLCFDKTHGHLLNDPANWVENGYWPLYKELRRQHPEIPHDTEDGVEVYAKILDAFLPWRWLEENRIPLFQSIFASRVQFCGRAYDAHTRPAGDWQSFFSKAAEQLIYGEQIGWFHLNDLRYASPRRSFAKRMLQLRYALAERMNASEMAKFLPLTRPVEMVTSSWSGMGRRPVVQTARVLHSVWRRQSDGQHLVLFQNIVNQESTLAPQLPDNLNQGFLVIVRERQDAPEIVKLPATLPELKLGPYESQIWLIQPTADLTEECRRYVTLLKTLTEMTADCGPILTHVQDHAARNKIQAADGKWVAPAQASWMDNTFRPRFTTFDMDNDRWLQLGQNAKVFWGEVDFGDKPGTQLELWLAADAPRAGGTLRFYDAKSGEELASLTIPVTGDWADYKLLKVPVKTPFVGKHDLMTDTTGGCNLKTWRVCNP